MYRIALVVVPLALVAISGGSTDGPNSPYNVLESAKHYADLYNWAAATPLFARAEKELPGTDNRNRLYAHIGTLRLSTGSPIIQRSQYLSDLLAANPILEHDDAFRLFALTIKGALDYEIDSAAARKDWMEVIAVSKRLGNTKWINRAQGELGFCDFYDGDLASAQRKVASALLHATQAQDTGAEVFFLSTSALGLAQQNVLPETALEYARRAIRLTEQNPDIGNPALANEAVVSVLTNTGQFTEATRMVTELLKSPHLTVTNRLNYESAAATVAAAQHDLPSAASHLERAIRLSEPFGETRVIAGMRSTLASLYLEKGEPSRAEAVSRGAVEQLGKAGALPLLPPRLDSLAQILIAEKKYSEALVVYERAESIVDSLVGRGTSLLTKTAVIAGANDLYAHHFALVLNAFHDTNGAFAVIERGRARGLVDLILSQRIAVDTTAERQVAQLRIQMAGLRSPRAIKEQKDEIFIAEQRQLANPGLTIVAREHFRPASADLIEKRLGTSEVLFEYILAAPRSYVIAVCRSGARAFPLASQQVIDAAVQRYLSAIQKHEAAYAEASLLFKLVLQPVPRSLRDLTRYTVIPDGRLSKVPFDALMDGGHYVLEKHVVSYAPSATTLNLLRSKQSHGRLSGALVAVGGVPYEGNARVTKLAVERGYASSGKFLNLPDSVPEIEAALHALPNPKNRTLSGTDATESKVKSALENQFGYVHLAVHAFASDDPDRAAIVVLSDAAKNEDGFIEASEIIRMHMNTKLVVLSACETDVGPIQGQEEMSSLSTAFLLAGSQNVVSTLWRVEDQPTLLLMKAFYHHIGAGDDAADALANAKRDLLTQFGTASLPAYWAGFVMQGSSDELSRARGKKTPQELNVRNEPTPTSSFANSQ